jgi:hypothetical protein
MEQQQSNEQQAQQPTNKATFPPPPPFYKLYTFPPPPPPPPPTAAATDDAANAAASISASATAGAAEARTAAAAAAREAAAALLPLDIYQPPPPLPPSETFLKFGEVQSAGFLSHELGPDVPRLFKPLQQQQHGDTAAADASSAGAAASAASSAASASAGLPTPPVLDYTATLRALNKQYLQAYIDVLAALTSADAAPATDNGNSGGVVNAAVEGALKRVSDISSNLSFLLTSLRPHQAVQTVLHMQLRQIARRKERTKQVRDTIAEAKAFLAQHGLHYEEGSTNVAPDQPVDFEAIAAAAASSTSNAAAAIASSSVLAVVKLEQSSADAMDIDSAAASDGAAAAPVAKREPGSGVTATPAAIPKPAPSPAEQLSAFLDSIPD